ncbi:MAG: hypothetical protein JKY51_11880 [Opitutaceae bacterium]|nr:hypothetical protein [Opitutaceae bacterium]
MVNILNSLEKAIVKHRRKSLSRAIFAKHNGTIQRGPFEGMQLNGVANISQAAHGLKIFGLYESPIMDTMLEWCPAEVLVDIGAGDGYYPVGMLRANLVKRAVCFEATEAGRKAIQINADLNDVGDRIEIRGRASSDFTKTIEGLNLPPQQTIILCDIEGGEFEVITRELIENLSGAKFVIELHEQLIDQDKTQLRQKILSAFPENYQTTILSDSPRQWKGIPELEAMHDLDRALITSEGRKLLGEWLIAETLQEE